MKQQLRKPEHWQDFEDLCTILWGEIWLCPEIKKNGRTGQKQAGVDIYGTPKGEAAYYGIQCKGKDEYIHAQLTEAEVDREIEKAKNFRPQLKKFYFATTANKDATIEEYIRVRDLECRKAGLFEIHLFSWEDIVGLIDQYPRTHDWYVKKINFRSHFTVSVTFSDGSTKMSFAPNLFRSYMCYIEPPVSNPFRSSDHFIILDIPTNYKEEHEEQLNYSTSPQPYHHKFRKVIHNKSCCLFSFKVENTGDRVIEDYKLEFSVNGKAVVERVNKTTSFIDDVRYNYDVKMVDQSSGTFKPSSGVLIQKDFISSDQFCIRSLIEEPQEITIDWQLLSRDYNDEGVLIICLAPSIIVRDKKTYNRYDLQDLSFDEVLQYGYRLENDVEISRI